VRRKSPPKQRGFPTPLPRRRNKMENYQKRALAIIEEIMTKANEDISEKLDELFDDFELEDFIYYEGEINSLTAFYHKLIADQLINQGVTPTDIPLKFYTSSNTGLPVPSVDFETPWKEVA